MDDYHIAISTYKDKNGNIKVDAHWGIETMYAAGFATCISDEEDLDKFMDTLRKLITTGDISGDT